MNKTISFAENYSTVKQFQHYTFQNKLRDAVINTVAPISSLLEIDKKLMQKNRVQFLFLHHLFEDEIELFKKLFARFVSVRDFFIIFMIFIETNCLFKFVNLKSICLCFCFHYFYVFLSFHMTRFTTFSNFSTTLTYNFCRSF